MTSQKYQVPVLSIHAPCLLISQRVWGRDPSAKLVRSVQAASVEARAGASRSELERTENALTGQLRGLLAVVEAYPDLKASRSYLDLQQQITEAEEQIQYARRYYNGTVRELNILIDSFPSNLVARLFGYAHRDYFEIELATQRDSPALPFS